MNNLTSKQQSFIRQMAEGDDFARRGFDLLLKRPDFERFFDALSDVGLFIPSSNPAPIQGDTPGFYRIPYWEPLRYLEAVAKLSGERNDLELAAKIMDVVRKVSNWTDDEGNARDNHNTFHSFAQIIGLVPTRSVKLEDVDLIQKWLQTRFDRSTVAYPFLRTTIKHFLDSSDADDWRKACRIVERCTTITWVDDEFREDKKATTAISDFWVTELVKNTAAQLGSKLGFEAVTMFVKRAREVYSQGSSQRYSYISRPAVETHQQNHSWRGAENWSVEGLRDALLSWIDKAGLETAPFVRGMVLDDAEIIRRVGIYALDARFALFSAIFREVVSAALFSLGHLHELYNLLKNHFHELPHSEQTLVIMALRGIPKSPTVSDPDHSLRYVQRQWLSAIQGQGNTDVDEWYRELSSDPTLGQLSPHPDLLSYSESRWGHGPTPYPVQELIAFAEEGSIIDKLNSFVEESSWSGPSVRSLSDALSEAVLAKPIAFLSTLESFHGAKRAYQYGLLSAFKKLWDNPNEASATLDWDAVWSRLITFFRDLITPEDFWTEEVSEVEVLTPTRDWLPPLISEFLRAGTRSDEKAYPARLLPQAWGLIQILLARSSKQTEADPARAMDKAINSPKGIAVEALIDHALRSCRVSDADSGDHSDVWSEMAPTFDGEIVICRNDNFEFSTLAGAYVSHLHYMSREWCEKNFERIFPKDFPANCLSAIDGLAWAPPSGPIHDLLSKAGIFAWALRNSPKDFRARENILQRLVLGYLWEKETLSSSEFGYIFSQQLYDDLEEMARYLWSISEQPLSEKQKSLIIDFWRACLLPMQESRATPGTMLSVLSQLSCYLDAINEQNEPLLIAVAPYVGVNYNADRFVEELDRLFDTNPPAIGRIVEVMLSSYKPDYDYEDRLKKLLRKLANHHDTRLTALRLAERLVEYRLPGMVEFYQEVTSQRRPTESDPHREASE